MGTVLLPKLYLGNVFYVGYLKKTFNVSILKVERFQIYTNSMISLQLFIKSLSHISTIYRLIRMQ